MESMEKKDEYGVHSKVVKHNGKSTLLETLPTKHKDAESDSQESTPDLGDDDDWEPEGHDTSKALRKADTAADKSYQQKLIKEIKRLTNDYQLTYQNLKDANALSKGPLSKVDGIIL